MSNTLNLNDIKTLLTYLKKSFSSFFDDQFEQYSRQLHMKYPTKEFEKCIFDLKNGAVHYTTWDENYRTAKIENLESFTLSPEDAFQAMGQLLEHLRALAVKQAREEILQEMAKERVDDILKPLATTSKWRPV